MTMKPEACESEYDFVLVLRGISEATEEVESALFEVGCDDATISVRSGCVYLTFSRSAPSYKDAVLSAVRDVRKAGHGIEVLRVDDCNLVTQADIARRIGRTRQLVQQYINGTRGPGGFPPPACHIAERAPLWYWCEVSYWMSQNGIVKEQVAREATEVAIINCLLDMSYQQDIYPELAQELFHELLED
ncbi:MAG: helix-turn-helix transcriptional regulator [Planctomycetota bacterium]|nr:helix-turn-helix transcriptional regulator [Planctomycetota bacterium]